MKSKWWRGNRTSCWQLFIGNLITYASGWLRMCYKIKNAWKFSLLVSYQCQNHVVSSFWRKQWDKFTHMSTTIRISGFFSFQIRCSDSRPSRGFGPNKTNDKNKVSLPLRVFGFAFNLVKCEVRFSISHLFKYNFLWLVVWIIWVWVQNEWFCVCDAWLSCYEHFLC